MKKRYETRGREERLAMEEERMEEVVRRSLDSENQSAIAAQMGLSQSSVHRVLKRARAQAETVVRDGEVDGPWSQLALRPVGERTRPYGWVCFLQPVEGGLVKIGYTTNPRRYLAFHQEQSPLRLQALLWVRARPGIKAAYHSYFARYRRHGEWFEPAEPILQAIREFRAY